MTQPPTPKQAAPAVERRKELVAEAMASVTDLEGLDAAEQLARLDEVASVLSGVLHQQADQLGGPAGHPRP